MSSVDEALPSYDRITDYHLEGIEERRRGNYVSALKNYLECLRESSEYRELLEEVLGEESQTKEEIFRDLELFEGALENAVGRLESELDII